MREHGEEIGMDKDKILAALNRGECPDCGHRGFLEGPHAGLAVNIKCKGCGNEFDVCLPIFAERIQRTKDEIVHGFMAPEPLSWLDRRVHGFSYFLLLAFWALCDSGAVDKMFRVDRIHGRKDAIA